MLIISSALISTRNHSDRRPTLTNRDSGFWLGQFWPLSIHQCCRRVLPIHPFCSTRFSFAISLR